MKVSVMMNAYGIDDSTKCEFVKMSIKHTSNINIFHRKVLGIESSVSWTAIGDVGDVLVHSSCLLTMIY